MGEEHRRRYFERARFYIRIGQTVSIDHIGMPSAQVVDGWLQAHLRYAPEGRLFS
jgi:hypothetical protein